MGNTTKTGADGIVCDGTVEHLRNIARHRTALIIQGASNISGNYTARGTQTGLWCDEQIEGLRRITDAVHAEGAKIIIQLEHPGIRSMTDAPPAPSPFELVSNEGKRVCHVMTVNEIHEAQQEYVEAARRAVLAGYDGVELHASHGWMIHNFTNRHVNQRDDEYGRDELLFVKEIFDKIRENSPDPFIIGIRMAGFNPDLKTGIQQGKRFEKMGFDYISMSNNPVIKWTPQDLSAPDGYPFTPQIYSAAEMKKAVNIPVIAANGIRSTADANAILAETDIDMILVGRGMLADPCWAEKALSGARQIECLACPRCSWQLENNKCAALLLADRQGRQNSCL